MTVAVISDIHGNAWALDAVLADARARGATTFLDLGDTLDGPLDPAGTADRLMALGALTVRGNHDRWMVERREDTEVAALRPEHREWLATFPRGRRARGHRHVPRDARATTSRCCSRTRDPDGTHPRAVEEVAAALDGVDAPLILCGHTHVPRLIELPGGRRVVNPGSVGWQANRDPDPEGWAIGTGSPHARYALLHREDGRWRVEPRAVAYDWDAAVAAARAQGREDWVAALATGWPPA